MTARRLCRRCHTHTIRDRSGTIVVVRCGDVRRWVWPLGAAAPIRYTEGWIRGSSTVGMGARMSVSEIVGLALMFALLGVTIGAIVTGVRVSRREWRREEHARRLEAYARWLAARLTLTRASISFVAAFRALEARRHESTFLPMRQDEAQRARCVWCDAVREHDQAMASLLVWSGEPSLIERLGGLDPVTADVLRKAIDGDADSFDKLVRQLRATDRSALELTRSATTARPIRPYPLPQPLARLVASLAFILDRLRGGE